MSGKTSADQRSAIEKAIDVLNAFGDNAYTGIGVTELAKRSSLPKSTTFRILATLEAKGVVERVGKMYRLGKMLKEIGINEESELHSLLRDVLTPFLADLYSRTKQTVHLAVLDGTDVVYLNKLYGHLHVRSPSRIGGRVPAYCSAVGKVLLAHNSEAISQVLAHPLRAWTPNTITTPEALQAELARVRTENLAYDRAEILRGLNCIAAPILDRNRNPIAALSVSGPVGKFIPDAHATMLRQVCFEATRALAAALNARDKARLNQPNMGSSAPRNTEQTSSHSTH